MDLPPLDEIFDVVLDASDVSPRVADWARRFQAADDAEADAVLAERDTFSAEEASEVTNLMLQMSMALRLMVYLGKRQLNANEEAQASVSAPSSTEFDDALSRFRALPPAPHQLQAAHAETELALLEAVRRQLAKDPDVEQLEQLARIYNAIPPVDMDAYDPPPSFGLD